VGLARINHEDFYCNRRAAAATSLTVGGLAAQSVNILFQVGLLSSRLLAHINAKTHQSDEEIFIVLS